MPKEKEIQKKYIQGQLLKQQITAMMEQKNAIDERLAELAVSLDAISRLGEVKQGEEMWSSVGGGAFFRSDVKDTENVLVSIGAGVVAKKSRANAAAILKERIEELKKVEMQLLEEAASYAHQLEEIEGDLQQLVEEQEKEKGMKKKK